MEVIVKSIDFRNHVFNRLVHEYGFIKREDKDFMYKNEEMIMFFIIDRLSYSNFVVLDILLSPLDYFKNIYTKEAITRHEGIICVTEFLKINNDICSNYIKLNLDEIMDFEYIDEKIDEFFVDIFPRLQTTEDIKNFSIENSVEINDRNILKFWNVDERSWDKKRANKLEKHIERLRLKYKD